MYMVEVRRLFSFFNRLLEKQSERAELRKSRLPSVASWHSQQPAR